MSFASITNSEVFALTRLRRREGLQRRRAALIERHGPTRYFSVTTMPPPQPKPPPAPKIKSRAKLRKIRAITESHMRRLEFRSEEGLSDRLLAIREAQGGNCYLCKWPFAPDNGPTVDHVVPLSRGGGNRGNILLAHARCNNDKADRLPTPLERAILASVNYRLANDEPMPERATA